MVGDWGVQAASPFYTVVLSTSGRTTETELSVTNLVLQFPHQHAHAGGRHGDAVGGFREALQPADLQEGEQLAEVGEEIPEALYEAVAEILREVLDGEPA